jgi:RNA polymerase sigma-70 factor (ECF subfamily)
MVFFPTGDKRSDAELVEMCNSGSRDEAIKAFETLYRRHKDFVLRVANRYVRDTDQAMDVLQETFSYLLKKFPPPGPGLELSAKLTTFLYPVAKNSAITAARKAERYPSSGIDPDSLTAEVQTPDSDIETLLSDLPAERREVVLLRFVDDMPLQDIAAALDIPLGTVKSRLHLAIRQLRENPAAKILLTS